MFCAEPFHLGDKLVSPRRACLVQRFEHRVSKRIYTAERVLACLERRLGFWNHGNEKSDHTCDCGEVYSHHHHLKLGIDEHIKTFKYDFLNFCVAAYSLVVQAADHLEDSVCQRAERVIVVVLADSEVNVSTVDHVPE